MREPKQGLLPSLVQLKDLEQRVKCSSFPPQLAQATLKGAETCGMLAQSPQQRQHPQKTTQSLQLNLVHLELRLCSRRHCRCGGENGPELVRPSPSQHQGKLLLRLRRLMMKSQ